MKEEPKENAPPGSHAHNSTAQTQAHPRATQQAPFMLLQQYEYYVPPPPGFNCPPFVYILLIFIFYIRVVDYNYSQKPFCFSRRVVAFGAVPYYPNFSQQPPPGFQRR